MPVLHWVILKFHKQSMQDSIINIHTFMAQKFSSSNFCFETNMFLYSKPFIHTASKQQELRVHNFFLIVTILVFFLWSHMTRRWNFTLIWGICTYKNSVAPISSPFGLGLLGTDMTKILITTSMQIHFFPMTLDSLVIYICI